MSNRGLHGFLLLSLLHLSCHQCRPLRLLISKLLLLVLSHSVRTLLLGITFRLLLFRLFLGFLLKLLLLNSFDLVSLLPFLCLRNFELDTLNRLELLESWLEGRSSNRTVHIGTSRTTSASTVPFVESQHVLLLDLSSRVLGLHLSYCLLAHHW